MQNPNACVIAATPGTSITSEPKNAVDVMPNMTTGRRLLVLGCSKTKSDAPGEIPAMDRYQGTLHKILRKSGKADLDAGKLDIVFISGLCGFLHASTLIPNYDQKLTVTRARDLARAVSSDMQEWACGENLDDHKQFDEVAICLSRTYKIAIQHVNFKLLFWGAKIIDIDGDLMAMAAGLRDWLVHAPPRTITTLDLFTTSTEGGC